MSLTSWVKLVSGRLTNGRRRRGRRAAVAGGSTAIECLEIRALLAAFVVDTIVDESDGNLSAGDLSLREAIESANSLAGADTITFDAGVFGVAQTMNLWLGEFSVTDDVTITGPGQTLLTIDADDQSRHFRIDDGDDNAQIRVEISGLTLIQGRGTDGNNSTVTVGDTGGSILAGGEELVISEVTISESSSFIHGGAIYSTGPLNVHNSRMLSNASGDGHGGAIYVGGSAVIERTEFDGNTAPDRGGAISVLSVASLKLSASTLSGGHSADGGGLFNAGTAEVWDSLFLGNTAVDGGGISNSGHISTWNNTFSGNQVSDDAGAVYHSSFSPSITIGNSTIVGNFASNGGGIHIDSPVEIHNTIIIGNLGKNTPLDEGTPDDVFGTESITGGHNLIGDPGSAGGQTHGTDGSIVGQDDGNGGRELLDLSTLLDSLADNGGPTQTHALIPGSAAIDAGDPEFDPSAFDPLLSNDQRGTPFDRVADGDGNGTAIVDIGAFESPAAPNVAIAESGGNTQVGETSNPDAFGVTLNQAPQQPVIVDISIGDPQIITLSAATLTFTPQNWNQPQTITVNGVNDDIEAGDLTTIVQFTIDDSQSDDTFDGSINLLSVVMLDDDAVVAPEVTGPVGTSEETRPTITWTAIEGAESYEVWLQLIGGDNNPILNPTVSSTSFAVTTDLVIGRYRAWVRANFPTDSPSDWGTDTFQVDAVPVIQALPTDNDVTPTITWSPVAGATRYGVYLRNQTSGAIVANTTVTETSFTPTAALSFGQHQIWVRAIGVGNYSAKWSERAVYNVGPIQTAPVGAISASPSQFTWTAISGAATHQIYVTGPGILINESGITGNSFTPATPLPNGDYRWWIRGFTADGKAGPWGDFAEFTTGGRTHIATPLTFNSAGIPEISWPLVAEAQKYEVYISKVGTPGAFSRTTVSPDAEYKAPALNNGDYRVWIRTTLADDSNVWGRGVAFTIDAPVSDTIAVPTSPTGGTFGGNTPSVGRRLPEPAVTTSITWITHQPLSAAKFMTAC